MDRNPQRPWINRICKDHTIQSLRGMPGDEDFTMEKGLPLKYMSVI